LPYSISNTIEEFLSRGHRMIPSLTSAIAEIIARYGRIPLHKLFEEYNKLVFRGEALCTNWFEYEVNGRRVAACRSILYVLKHLRAEGAIELYQDNGYEVVEVLNREKLREFIEERRSQEA